MLKISLLFFITIIFCNSAFAYGNSDDTHYVDGYTRGDGTYVEGHEAGNPGSGVHCHDNFCDGM